MGDERFPFDEKQAGADAGSVTGMFGTSAAPKAAQDDLLAELLRPQTAGAPQVMPVVSSAPVAAPASVAPVMERLVPEGQKPGDVTRMLEELKALTGAVVEPLKPTPPKPAGPPVAAELKPGEFTRIFRQLPTPQPKSAPAAPVVAAVPAPEQAGQEPKSGEFTQFFKKSVATGGASSGVAASGSPAAPAPAWPESFAADAPQKTPDAPGSFTQMFRTLSASENAAPAASAAVPAPASPPVQVAPANSSSGPGAFTQMFQTLSPNAEQPRSAALPPMGEPLKPVAPVHSAPPVFSAPPSSSTLSGRSNQGGFTQLFESLSPSGAPVQQAPFSPAPLPSTPAASPIVGGSGEFTRLMHSLSEPAVAGPVAPPMGPPMGAPVAQPQAMPQSGFQSGPGEYTRIISGSAMREAGGGAAFPPMAPPVAAPPAAFAPPVAMKAPSFAPPAGAHPPAPAGFGMPQGFAPPAAPAPAPAPQGKLQQYLPLILVLNGALLLIVVIVLVFALRHH